MAIRPLVPLVAALLLGAAPAPMPAPAPTPVATSTTGTAAAAVVEPLVGSPSDLSGSAVGLVADTIVAVRPGDRLHVQLREGRVVLEGIDGGALEVEDQSRRSRLEVVRRGARLDLRVRDGDEGAERVLRLRVPHGLPVDIDGHDLEVDASGMGGALRVQVIDGDLRARRIGGDVELRTVSGDIEVTDVTGGVVVATVDGRVHVAGVRGRVAAESMDGDLTLDDVDGPSVEGVTVDGDVYYRGPLTGGTRVRLVTHDGDVVAVVPTEASAEVEISTFDGEFLPEFPVRVGRVEAGQPLRFRMGSGAARLDIQVFDGDIQLRHGPGR